MSNKPEMRVRITLRSPTEGHLAALTGSLLQGEVECYGAEVVAIDLITGSTVTRISGEAEC